MARKIGKKHCHESIIPYLCIQYDILTLEQKHKHLWQSIVSCAPYSARQP